MGIIDKIKKTERLIKPYAKMLFYNTLCKWQIQLFGKKDKRKLKYNVSLCLIFKDEAPFLKEWFDYHLTVGVEHFYLYNNNSTDNYLEVIQPYIENGFVTLIEWSEPCSQMKAYNHCYDNYRHETRWLSFLDADEFIVPRYANTIQEWLHDYEKFPAVVIHWRMFGTGGLLKHDYSKNVIEQYFTCSDTFYKYGKCFINTRYDIADNYAWYLHHQTHMWYRFVGIKIKLPAVDQKYNFSLPNHSWKRIKLQDSTIAINHYYSKAWDITKAKLSKTDVFFKDNQIARGNIDFCLEKEMLTNSCDYTIIRFLIKIKLHQGII